NTLVAVGVVPREVAGSGRTVQELVNRCMEVVAPLVGHVELDGDGTADLHRYFTLRKPSLSRYRSGVGRQEQRDRRLWSSTGQLTRFLPRLKSWASSLNLCVSTAGASSVRRVSRSAPVSSGGGAGAGPNEAGLGGDA